MGKFVTYGATETLDNDQKFIIDSDRTGPGSITAKDAASSLLSKWAGFDTFEEAVQNTISNNQEFIDRDTAIRSETAELKKKIVTTFPAKDASGAVATFESEFEDAPLKSCIVRVEPVQDLHGYDHPWPAGGGKNLIENSVYVIPDTSSAEKIWTGNLNGTYTISIDKRGITSVAVPSQAAGRCTVDGVAHYLGYNTGYITVSGNLTDISIYGSSAYARMVGTLRIQLESGSTATTWTPYSNECPITGWTGCEVQRTGKNLFDKAHANIFDGYFTGSGGELYKGPNFKTLYIPCKPNTTYTMQKMTSYTFAYGWTNGDLSESPTINCDGVISQGNTRTITTGADAVYLCAYVYNAARDTVALDDILIVFRSNSAQHPLPTNPIKDKPTPSPSPQKQG